MPKGCRISNKKGRKNNKDENSVDIPEDAKTLENDFKKLKNKIKYLDKKIKNKEKEFERLIEKMGDMSFDDFLENIENIEKSLEKSVVNLSKELEKKIDEYSKYIKNSKKSILKEKDVISKAFLKFKESDGCVDRCREVIEELTISFTKSLEYYNEALLLQAKINDLKAEFSRVFGNYNRLAGRILAVNEMLNILINLIEEEEQSYIW